MKIWTFKSHQQNPSNKFKKLKLLMKFDFIHDLYIITQNQVKKMYELFKK